MALRGVELLAGADMITPEHAMTHTHTHVLSCTHSAEQIANGTIILFVEVRGHE